MNPEPAKDSDASTTSGTAVVQFSVMLDNRAGALRSLEKMLSDRHINVIGLTLSDSFEISLARLIVTDPFGVETLFIERGIAFQTTEVVVVELKGGPNDLGPCLNVLNRAEVNIHSAYPLLVQPEGASALVLCVEDCEFGSRVLSDNGLKVFFQEDLSR
ncbi:MAG: hypothetical protein AAGA58_14970 [Verrucomicrobiota bacterium]